MGEIELGTQYTRRRFHELRLAAMELLRATKFDEDTRGVVPVDAHLLMNLYRAVNK